MILRKETTVYFYSFYFFTNSSVRSNRFTFEYNPQGVKWLKAFSAKAAKDSRMVIEIKMSNVGLDMQGRRFAIIRNILTSNNVPADRINPVLTTRNPDTVILKTSVMPQEDGNIPVIDAMGGSYLDATPQK